MGWPGSIGVGILTAATATVAAGWIANLSVGWYRISSFEGKSGYFVVAMALLGLIGGLIIGMVTSRIVTSGASPGFLKALGLSQLITLGVIAVIGGAARLLADVAPTLDGEEMLLAVEVRWPEGQRPPVVSGSVEWSLRLGSSVSHTMRASETGPFWREDARQEEGRWIVPGAVKLFTSRGDRILDVLPEGIVENGWVVPLPGRPGKNFLEWSEWGPRARDGQPPLPDGFRYRFKVVPVSQPIRTERLGPFEVVTIASSFGEVTYGGQPTTWNAAAKFVIRHNGQPISFEQRDTEGYERVDVVAALAGPRAALLVQADANTEGAACHLVVADSAGPTVTTIEPCGSPRHATPLTDDPVRYAAARDRTVPDGRFDRTVFAVPGYYHLRGVILDTRTLSVRPYSTDDQYRLIERIPPLGISPDGDSFVRLEFGEDSDGPLNLAVTRLGSGERYRVAIDAARMRYMEIDQIDPAWLLHHFAWQRDAGGPDRLVERPGFAPLPWRGTLTDDYTGYREYRIGPALAGLRPALIEFLATEFGAERLPTEEGAYSHEVRIGDTIVHVSFNESEHHVGIWIDRGTDSRLVATIGERFDAALRTGKYDHLFGR